MGSAPSPRAHCPPPRLGHCAHVLALTLTWYSIGLGLVYVNKFMLTDEKFHFPFITVLVTNLWLWLAAVFLTAIGWFRPQSISWALFKWQAVPTGICTGLDIGTANWSLQYLNVTFFTMIRGTIPSFVLVFSMCCGLEQLEPIRVASTLAVCVGIALASMGELEFHVPGVVMCVLSCTIAGARWVLIELMMATPQPRLGPSGGVSSDAVLQTQRTAYRPASGTTPLGTILLVTPVTICACAPFAAIFELRAFLRSRWVTDPGHWRQAMAYLAAVTVLSFLLTLSKFHLVKATSSLNMSLMGILKQLLQILGAVLLFGDRLTVVRALGFATCSAGLACYNIVECRELCAPGALGGCGGSAPADGAGAHDRTPGLVPWQTKLVSFDGRNGEMRALLPIGRPVDDESASDGSSDPILETSSRRR